MVVNRHDQAAVKDISYFKKHSSCIANRACKQFQCEVKKIKTTLKLIIRK